MDAVNLAKLAREIAMDILPIGRVLSLNRIADDDWEIIQADPRFQAQLQDMIRDWNSAGNAKDRVRVKAATGFEALMEVYLADAMDPNIPLVQRVEVGKLLAKLGELEAAKTGGAGGQVLIQINFGEKEVVTKTVPLAPQLTLVE